MMNQLSSSFRICLVVFLTISSVRAVSLQHIISKYKGRILVVLVVHVQRVACCQVAPDFDALRELFPDAAANPNPPSVTDQVQNEFDDTPCSDRVCMNGGRCEASPTDVTLTRCVCSSGFEGDDCARALGAATPTTAAPQRKTIQHRCSGISIQMLRN